MPDSTLRDDQMPPLREGIDAWEREMLAFKRACCPECDGVGYWYDKEGERVTCPCRS